MGKPYFPGADLRLQPMSTWSCGACTYCRGSQAFALLGCALRCWKRCQKYKSIGSWVLMMSVYTGSMHDMYFFIYIHYTHLLYMHVLLIYMYTYVYHIFIHISYIFNLTVCLLTLSIEHCPRSFQTQAGINSEGQSRFGPSSVPWLWWRRL